MRFQTCSHGYVVDIPCLSLAIWYVSLGKAGRTQQDISEVIHFSNPITIVFAALHRLSANDLSSFQILTRKNMAIKSIMKSVMLSGDNLIYWFL